MSTRCLGIEQQNLFNHTQAISDPPRPPIMMHSSVFLFLGFSQSFLLLCLAVSSVSFYFFHVGTLHDLAAIAVSCGVLLGMRIRLIS